MSDQNSEFGTTSNQVAITENNLPSKFSPLGAWTYFWLEILFSIPVIGFIFAIIFACGAGGNINLRNFARSRFCVLGLVLIIAGIVVAIGVAGGSGIFETIGDFFSNFF